MCNVTASWLILQKAKKLAHAISKLNFQLTGAGCLSEDYLFGWLQHDTCMPVIMVKGGITSVVGSSILYQVKFCLNGKMFQTCHIQFGNKIVKSG